MPGCAWRNTWTGTEPALSFAGRVLDDNTWTACHIVSGSAWHNLRHVHSCAQAAAVYAITSAVILAAAFALLFAPQYALLAR